MNRIGSRHLGCILAMAATASCAGPSWVEAAVEAYGEPREQLADLRTFRLEQPADSEHQLRDREMLEQVAILLERRGLVRAGSGDADFSVRLHAAMHETTIVVPAHYEMGTRFTPGFYRTSYRRGSDGNLHPTQVYCPGGYSSAPYRVPASSIPAFAHQLRLDFRDAEGAAIWQGSIDIIDRSRDLFGLLDLFLPQLLEEFPGPSGRGIERKAQRLPYSESSS